MKQTTDILTIAVIGAGYAARLHGDAYKRVYGASLRLKWSSIQTWSGRKS